MENILSEIELKAQEIIECTYNRLESISMCNIDLINNKEKLIKLIRYNKPELAIWLNLELEKKMHCQFSRQCTQHN